MALFNDPGSYCDPQLRLHRPNSAHSHTAHNGASPHGRKTVFPEGPVRPLHEPPVAIISYELAMARPPGSPTSSTATASAAADARREQQTASLDEAVKRQRACDSCRRAKVRCMPSPLDARGSPCLRCMRADKICITSPPAGPRKKRKKAINKVNELEKKIDLLTASLHARDAGAPPLTEGPGASGAAGPMQRLADQPSVEEGEEDDGEETGEVGEDTAPTPRTDLATDSGRHAPVDIDIVRRGLISADDADKLLARYNTQMVRHLPAVVFPSSLNAAELRRTRPMVFFAVMAAATYSSPALQKKLVRELTRAFAHKIIVAAEKSLELVQALQISILWYWPPNHYEELQIYQLGQMSITMAIEISLGRCLPEKKQYARHAFRRKEGQQDTTNPDPSTLEARRAWLACYYLASNMTVTMQRPMALTWTRFMTESYEILRTSPDRAPTDEYFCALVWAHRLSEDAAQQIAGDDLRDPANASRTAYSLRKVDQDLTQLRSSLSGDFVRETLAITLASLPLYMHGAVLDYDAIEDKQQRPSRPVSSPTTGIVLPDATALAAADIQTVSYCLHNVRVVTKTFLRMDTDTIRSLPTFTFGRVIIASAMLFRIYVFVDQDSNLSSVIDKNELGVGLCIDRLIHQFRVAAADRLCRPAARFLAVLLVIKNAFVKYCEYQGFNKRHGSREKALHVSQSPRLNRPSAMKQAWPSLQQQQQQQHSQPEPQTHGNGSRMTFIQPDTSMVPLSGGPDGDLLLPYDVNFFAQSAEEFAYSLDFMSNNEYFTGYETMGDFGLDVEVAVGQTRFGDVDLTNFASQDHGREPGPPDLDA
ncbi:hypothetical protein FDECE_2864 [Fusarium decemcellulare]|nr:hypothetical protein FDECE_2864 [Fusarium decemcellulare]